MGPTESDELLVTLDAGVLTLVLDRPASRNALSLRMLDALAAALDDGLEREDVRVIVLTGAGSAFCAGGDVATFARGESIFGPMDEPGQRLKRQTESQRATVVRLWESPKPTIALLNGPVVGAGLGLALACDLRIAAASAVLRTGFVRVGLAGDFGCSWLLTQAVGAAKAKELLYLSETVPAESARELGLVNEVVADERLTERGMAIARRLAEGPGEALAAVKANVANALRNGLAECADDEVRAHVRLLGSRYHRDAVAAMARRRST
ncbi:enoyl-CoA hydratase/isomerase family protein [Actinomadura rugatobispora]|uniref:Enoyl-CoA hydratase/isomerase family protein n=1 Tax=Actinomadura rugatobispora TaxID=1994 RepID=A0ABW1A1I8_9ACTN|nr:enoyl-CoA hydratase [Actinomadura rugatobispora]